MHKVAQHKYSLIAIRYSSRTIFGSRCSDDTWKVGAALITLLRVIVEGRNVLGACSNFLVKNCDGGSSGVISRRLLFIQI
jgi:hypothetical protein